MLNLPHSQRVPSVELVPAHASFATHASHVIARTQDIPRMALPHSSIVRGTIKESQVRAMEIPIRTREEHINSGFIHQGTLHSSQPIRFVPHSGPIINSISGELEGRLSFPVTPPRTNCNSPSQVQSSRVSNRIVLVSPAKGDQFHTPEKIG